MFLAKSGPSEVDANRRPDSSSREISAPPMGCWVAMPRAAQAAGSRMLWPMAASTSLAAASKAALYSVAMAAMPRRS
jgi:hypothetical protein